MANREKKKIRIPRKIYFYKVKFWKNSEEGKILVNNLEKVFSEIKNITPGTDEWYLADKENNARTCMFIDHNENGEVLGNIGWSRKDIVPDKEIKGKLESLELGENEALYYPTHFYFKNIPEKGIYLAVEFNSFGPRHGRIKQYLLEKAGNIVDEMELIPIVWRDSFERWMYLEDSREVKIEVNVDLIENIRQIDAGIASLIEKTKNLAEDENLGKVIIMLKPRSGKEPMGRRIANKFKQIFSNAPGSNLRVRGRSSLTGKIEVFDLIKDKMVFEDTFITTDKRKIPTEQMYSKLREAFSTLQPHIKGKEWE